ncbi:MAG: RtcB family protein [Acidimicrobiia bacterium]|nr:RtcB family protein [Acidimicrobiia bacterium]
MPNTINDKLISWASDVEEGTIRQAEKTARLPIVDGHVALMPDAHVGIGATVGSVIPTSGAIIPAAVGVDIGCGMIAVETDLTADQLPDDLDRFQPMVAKAVPAGLGKWHAQATRAAEDWFAANLPPRDLGELGKRALDQFGTLGSGNHFFEVCLDERDVTWIVLHSGSRGVGNKLATQHIERARTLAKQLELGLEDRDLAYFTQDQPEFDAYLADLLWAQAYALGNREQMMDAALRAFFLYTGTGCERRRINCHHNFTALETHEGRELWSTRKGAIRADVTDHGVIPGSMGTRSYIVRGKGSEASYKSCSHGAGRRLSRSAARKRFTVEDMAAQMANTKSWQRESAADLIDEIPAAYKDVDQVMADQADLVEVEHALHQILNYKGTDSGRGRRRR